MRLARPPDQHHRYPRSRRLHGRGRAFVAGAGRVGRGVRRGGRRGAADGDGLASGRQVPRAPHLLREQDGPRGRRLRPHPRVHPDPAGRQSGGSSASARRRGSLRGGHRPRPDEGGSLRRRRIARGRAGGRGHSRAVARAGHGVPGAVGGKGQRGQRRHPEPVSPRRAAARVGAAGDHPAAGDRIVARRGSAVRAGAVRVRVQEQGRAAAAGRHRRLPSVAGGRAAHHRHQPPAIGDGRRLPGRAGGGRHRAFLGAGVQGDDRPLRRPVDLHPRLLGGHEDGRDGAQHRTGPQGAHRPPAEDAREQARGDPAGLRRRHRRGGRSEERRHRRHDLRSAARGGARVDGVPEPGHQSGDRAEHEGRPGEAGAGTGQAHRRGSDVPGADGRRGRAGRHIGDGRAASRDSRRPTEARVRRGGERRPPAGRLQGNADPSRGRRGPLRQADGRTRSSTGT